MKLNNITKIICCIVIVFILLCIFLPSLLTTYNDYAHITDVEYKAVVVDEPDGNGKIHVTERLTFDVHAAEKDNLFWELWRDLPEDYIDDAHVHYDVLSVKQILDDGTEVVYDESPRLYWDDYHYEESNEQYGPGKWFHSPGPYNEDARNYECVLFYVNGLYREEVVFEIEYEMYNATLRYGDCSDLYISLYSDETINYLESYKAEILFPNEIMPSRGNYTVTTYGTENDSFPVTESATANPGYYTFSIDLDEDDLKFSSYNEYIEFDLVAFGDDKHIFTEYASRNRHYNDNILDEIIAEQEKYSSSAKIVKIVRKILFPTSIVISLIIILYTLTTEKRMHLKHTFYKSSHEISYSHEIPSDLDPKFAADLVFCKHSTCTNISNVYSAILLSLARKHYIEIVEDLPDDIRINILKKTPPFIVPTNSFESHVSTEPDIKYEPLTYCEEAYFNLIVRHAENYSICMNVLESRISSDYDNTTAFLEKINNSTGEIGLKNGYFQKTNYREALKQIDSAIGVQLLLGILCIIVNIFTFNTRIGLASGSFIILSITCFICSAFLNKQMYKYILLTQFGEDEYVKWRSFYNYLNNDTLFQNTSYRNLATLEKYLVYATAFGISDKVSDALRLNMSSLSSSLPTVSKSIINNPCSRSLHYHGLHQRLHHHNNSGSFSAGSTGGGRGGGGRGGGGGGGGH